MEGEWEVVRLTITVPQHALWPNIIGIRQICESRNRLGFDIFFGEHNRFHWINHDASAILPQSTGARCLQQALDAAETSVHIVHFCPEGSYLYL